MQERATDQMLALSETFRAFAERATDLASLLDTIAYKLAELVGDACVVSLADADGAWIDPSAACGNDPAATAILQRALGRRALRDRSGQAARVVETDAPVWFDAIEPAELARRVEPAFADAVTELGIRSFIAVPLQVRERRLGVLSVFRYVTGGPPFTEYDLALALSVGDHAALAIANAQLFESLQRELGERAKAEARAKTFVALIENSADLIAMADFEGRVLFMNAAGRALLGLGSDTDARTLTLADMHTEDGLKRAPILRERGSWHGDGVLRHQQTGELIATRVSSFLVRDTDGEPLCFATVQHDQRAKLQLEAQLRQAQKMEALGRLAGGIAHDFNNLLTVISSYSAMLALSIPAGSRGARDVAQIDRAAHRAAELTRQLLAFSRRQVLEPKPLDLGGALQAMAEMIQRLIGEDIELRITADADVGLVMADAGQVEQVVMNLVVNARDAMAGGGTLALATSRIDIGEGAAPELTPGPYVRLSISDTGTGIDEAALPHLFEPFFTTKDHGKGTGLGLSTAMGIVQQSGGHVTVESAVGRGSTFHVFLPVTDDSPPTPIAIPRTPTPLTVRQRILVVEDEEQVRELICEVLSQAGYDVLGAVDGADALEIASSAPGGFDLVLTDVIMPRLSGRELAARIHERWPATRVLYMSGYTDDKLGHHGLLDPDVELIQKPLTPDALLRRVRGVLA